MKLQLTRKTRAFTLIELLVVIGVLAILSAIAMPVYSKIRERAHMVNHVANVKALTMHTLRWAADNSQTLPSPQYPGGHSPNDPAIPEQWDFTGSGTGLWLDGVIFYAATAQAAEQRAEDDEDAEPEPEEGDSGMDTENGKHLKDTIFFSLQSFKKDTTEENMYLHSYAMNRSLQYDYIYSQSTDPELTSKNLARILHRPSAMVFIENEQSNIVGFDSITEIIETGKKRWSSRQVIAGFLDGSCRTMTEHDIPEDDVTEDRASSRFWRGVDPDTFTGEQ